MTPALCVWDIPEPEIRARDRGIARAGAAHYRDLQIARQIAHELAQDGRAISADDVRAALAERHPDIDGCMNWMGSVFRGEEWQAVGFVKSRTKGSHSNRLIQWRLK